MTRPQRRFGSQLSWATGLAVTLYSQASIAFPTSRLTYARGSGAEACPDELSVRHAVAARLGYDPFFPSAEKTIVARIVRTRDELHATVELVDERGIMRGVRELRASPGQCGELVATVALAISIAIDPTNPAVLGVAPASSGVDPNAGRVGVNGDATSANERRSQSKDRLDRDARRGPEESAHADDGPDAASPDRSRRELPPKGDAARGAPIGFQVRPGVAVIGTFGTAPAATMGLAISADLRRGRWSLDLEGRGDLPASTEISGGGGVRTSLWVGALGPCFHLDPVYLCVTAWVGSQHAEGVDLAVSRSEHALYVAAGSRTGLEVPLGDRFAFRPELAVQTAFRPVALQVDSATQWVAPRVALLAAAGLSVHFP